MKFQVGVIGATGFIGSAYRQEIREAKQDATIVALCARNRERLEAAAEEDSCDFITDDWRQVVDRPDVNFVIVATPDALHHEAVMASAKNGKHMFCDKPIGMNVTEAYEMRQAYREAGLSHFVPFWARCEPLFLRGKEIVDAGTLGDIRAIIYRWQNPRPAAMPFTWRDDATLSAAGSIADVGSHAYDAVRWLTGTEAKRVLAHADTITPPKPDLGTVYLNDAIEWGGSHTKADSEKQRKGTAFDYAAIAWEFQSGAVGSIVLSHAPILRKGLAPEVELHGTDASLAIDRVACKVSVLYADQDVPEVEQVDPSGPGNRFENFVFPALERDVAGEASNHPSLNDGWRVQIFTHSAALSARRGTWVELADQDAEAK